MPWAALAPALISTVGGGLFGLATRGGNKSNLGYQNALMQQQLARDASGYGRSWLSMGQQANQALLSHYLPLLKGSRTAMMEEMAPELGKSNEMYDTAGRAASALLPRGGGRSSLMAEIPYRKVGASTDILLGGRREAAGALGGLAGQSAQAGGSLLGTAGGMYRGATSDVRSMLDYEIERQRLQQESGAAWGRSLFEMLKNVDFGTLFAKKPQMSSGSKD